MITELLGHPDSKEFAATLVSVTDPNHLLRTCRRQYQGELEVAQLLSWQVAYYTWLVLERAPDEDDASLKTLRPNAHWTGADCPCAAATMKAAKEAVRAAGKKSATPAEARHKEALKALPELAARVSGVRRGMMGLTEDNGTGLDAWCYPAAVHAPDVANGAVVLMQAKGVMTGKAAGVSGGDHAVGSALFAYYLAGAGNEWADWKAELAPDEVPAEAALELLENHRVTEVVLVPAPPKGVNAVAFISRSELVPALGKVFGGIAARCIRK